MLVIKPIQDKAVQRKLVEACGGTYDETAFAYCAKDCEDDGETLRHLIGVCQFTLLRGKGVIQHLRAFPNVEDDEALMIMCRAAMSFLFRCAAETAEFCEDNPALAEKLDFLADADGRRIIDLKRFYGSPCHYRA